MRPFRPTASLVLLAALASCNVPPSSAYLKDDVKAATIPVGRNTAGESCEQDAGPHDARASIYCGSWQQPSARVALSDQAGTLAALAATSPWRDTIDRRLDCKAGTASTILGGDSAIVFACTARAGGWPEVALVAQANGRIYEADGVAPALPAIERSIGILSGSFSPSEAASEPVSNGLAAQRLAGASFKAGDIGQYNTLMFEATQANLASNYAAAESLYRQVAALEERVLGRNAPGLAPVLAAQALNLSNQGEYPQAAELFARAAPLAASPDQSDPLAMARLHHYQGLDQLNQNHPDKALDLLRQAGAGYEAQLPPGSLTAEGTASGDESSLLTDTPQVDAMLGVIEARRGEAVALRHLGRLAESTSTAQSAVRLATINGLAKPRLTARLTRTAAYIAESEGNSGAALTGLSQSALAFGRAFPGSRPYAETDLLLAAQLRRSGNNQAALAACRTAAAVLRNSQEGTSGTLLQPCLEILDATASADAANEQSVLAEMFAITQLTRTTETSEQIAQASARLMENARDPRVAALIRTREQQTTDLAALYQERDDARAASHQDSGVDAGYSRRITELEAKQAELDQALQAASPNYGQLTQKVVGASAVLSALHPGEAFAAVFLFKNAGWTFLLRDGHIWRAAIPGGSTKVAALVHTMRASLDADVEPPPPFDVASDRALYTLVLGGVEQGLRGATALSVAPTGPLLSVPFGMLLTGPADAANLAAAPWLIQRMTVEHVPAPANFISLRKLAGTTRATQPWFGFGDFEPVTLAQAEASYPVASCGDSARLLAGLPPLPGAVQELQAVRQIEGASAGDLLLGPAFTASAVRGLDLKRYKVLHFATHALLPSDLRCQAEPALITSAPLKAANADGAMLRASDVATLQLDADAVILSACNTGGAGSDGAGESLAGLARSFFYAGARALLVTHWSVNDRATAYLVALTLNGAATRPGEGLAGALAAAQRKLIAGASGDVAGQAHPFYWAALAVIGEGMGTGAAQIASR